MSTTLNQLGANGLSLLNDYILGISPTDATTKFTFGIKRMANGVQALFTPYLAGGRVYQLQATTNLAAPVWTNVPNLTATQNGNGQGVLSVTNLTGTNVFYRLQVQLTP